MELIKDSIDLSKYMDDEEGHLIKPANDWTEEVINHFHAPADVRYAPKLPWLKTHETFEFRRGEVSIVAGINGHGKSQLWGHVVLGLIDQGEKVCMASLEMKPFRTMVRMARQASGQAEPSPSFIKQFGRWTDGKLWLYDKIGNCKPDVMLALIRYAVDKFAIDHFVIDNLTKVIPGEDSYSEQKDFVNAVCGLAADLDIHITIVMHVRKGASEKDIPNKMSVKGAGSVTDMVDNCFIVWRNKEKEAQARAGEPVDVNEADAVLVLDKHRNGEEEGSWKLWFHRDSMQYLEKPLSLPRPVRAISNPNWN